MLKKSSAFNIKLSAVEYLRMKVPSIALMFTLLSAPVVHAAIYEVLVVEIVKACNHAMVAEFEETAGQLNALHREGYPAAKPYFNVLHMANGQVYLVFGFRGEVQGIHRQNYPKTVKNLSRKKHEGAPKYPNMHWLPVEEIRRLLVSP